MDSVFAAARRGDVASVRRYIEEDGFNVNLVENSTSKQGMKGFVCSTNIRMHSLVNFRPGGLSDARFYCRNPPHCCGIRTPRL
jgi:hypothetical protein